MNYCPTEHIEFSISNGYLGLDELVSISMLNKSYNLLAKREIKNIYQIIKNIRKSKIIVNNSSLYSFSIQEKYDNNYWYQIFGRKLNHQELAIYYAYFITKYNISGKFWTSISYQDGFIKLLGAQSDGSLSLSQYEPETIIQIKNNYLEQDHDITFTYEYINRTKPNNYKISIDEKLLIRIVNFIKKNTVYDFNLRRYTKKPNINDAIEHLYPIIIH